MLSNIEYVKPLKYTRSDVVIEYEKNLELENDYLERTLSIVKSKLQKEEIHISGKREELVAANKDLYESIPISNSGDDFGKIAETAQHLNTVQVQAHDFMATSKRIKKYKKLLNSPYFARIDFTEEGFEKESIYIGLGNLTDEENYDIYIYDWRVPIASIFYRYELGKASYNAPNGVIKGEVTLKRQYEIKEGKLQYFFDSRVNVLDDILKKALSGNTSSKMKTIVESIQREQDIIIRDIESDLVIVQGVAGSGKTSVALHRVAFLMYQGLTEKLSSNNIVLISPNSLFGQYISSVLPELGEENIATLTFEDIFKGTFKKRIPVESRNSLLEEIITAKTTEDKKLLKSSIEFKLSNTFIEILERYVRHYEHKMIDFNDIYFDGKCIANRHLLKMDLLNNKKRHIPVEKRLKQIETKIIDQVKELSKIRIDKVEKFVYEKTNHPFDSRAFARLLMKKQYAAFKKNIDKFFTIDYLSVYKNLFRDKALFYRLSKGLDLPSNIGDVLDYTNRKLQSSSKLRYEDAISLLYFRIIMEGSNSYYHIKQVVVDEAQDYYPMHYMILKHLYPQGKFTVVGDVNQTIEKQTDLSTYSNIKTLLNKKQSTMVYLTKSFRCSHEINTFSSKFIDKDIQMESFDRHGSYPEVISKSTEEELYERLVQDAIDCQNEGYSSVAIVCKSMAQAKGLHNKIRSHLSVELITEGTADTVSGILILPVYMAKGLEFDGVLVWGTDDTNYNTEDDKHLLYIACTRALHTLKLYHTGKASKFL